MVFYLLPPSLRVDITDTIKQEEAALAPASLKADQALLEKLKGVAPVVKARMQQKGQAMIGFQPLKVGVKTTRSLSVAFFYLFLFLYFFN